MRHYNKLVRDKIIKIIESHGEEPVFRKIRGEELEHRMKMKIREELNELISASNDEEALKEFADLYEIIDAYRKHRGFTQAQVSTARKEKNELRGKFKEGYLLIGAKAPRTEEEIRKDIEADELHKQLLKARHTNTKITVELQKGSLQLSNQSDEG